MDEIEELRDRLIVLSTALKYGSDSPGFFTRGERICINQERASNMRKLAFYQNECSTDEGHGYKVPNEIELKIKDALTIIEKTGWVPSKIIKY